MRKIAVITGRLMLVFLSLVASCMAFLSSPAIALTTQQAAAQEQQATEFKSTDKNNSGKIEREELPSAGSRDEEYLKIFSNSKYSSYDEFLKKNDADGDGTLNFEEFAKAWISSHASSEDNVNIQVADLANFFTILTILEPDSEFSELTARLANAGTATEGETDTKVLREIKKHLPELQQELQQIQKKKFERQQKVVTKILTPDN